MASQRGKGRRYLADSRAQAEAELGAQTLPLSPHTSPPATHCHRLLSPTLSSAAQPLRDSGSFQVPKDVSIQICCDSEGGGVLRCDRETLSIPRPHASQEVGGCSQLCLAWEDVAVGKDTPTSPPRTPHTARRLAVTTGVGLPGLCPSTRVLSSSSKPAARPKGQATPSVITAKFTLQCAPTRR